MVVFAVQAPSQLIHCRSTSLCHLKYLYDSCGPCKSPRSPFCFNPPFLCDLIHVASYTRTQAPWGASILSPLCQSEPGPTLKTLSWPPCPVLHPPGLPGRIFSDSPADRPRTRVALITPTDSVLLHSRTVGGQHSLWHVSMASFGLQMPWSLQTPCSTYCVSSFLCLSAS